MAISSKLLKSKISTNATNAALLWKVKQISDNNALFTKVDFNTLKTSRFNYTYNAAFRQDIIFIRQLFCGLSPARKTHMVLFLWKGEIWGRNNSKRFPAPTFPNIFKFVINLAWN